MLWICTVFAPVIRLDEKSLLFLINLNYLRNIDVLESEYYAFGLVIQEHFLCFGKAKFVSASCMAKVVNIWIQTFFSVAKFWKDLKLIVIVLNVMVI